MTPSASVLKPNIVRFLYRLRRCNKMCNLLPSRFKKCGYWRQNVTSSGVSSSPLPGRISSWDRRVRLLFCIFTANEMDDNSVPIGFRRTKRVNVNEQSLEMIVFNYALLLFYRKMCVLPWYTIRRSSIYPSGVQSHFVWRRSGPTTGRLRLLLTHIYSILYHFGSRLCMWINL